MAISIKEFKEKYGASSGREDHLQSIITNATWNRASTYVAPTIKKQVTTYKEANKATIKQAEKEAKTEIKNAKVEAKAAKKAKKLNMTPEQIEDTIRKVSIEFAAKHKLNQLELTMMGVKLSAKAMMNAEIQKLIPLGIAAYKRYSEGDDAENILIDAFKSSNLDEDTVKNIAIGFWKDLKSDNSMKDIVQLAERFIKDLNGVGLTLEGIYEVYRDALMEQLNPEDDNPEELAPEAEATEEAKPEVKQAAAAPESVIPEEVLDSDGKVVANVPAPVEQVDTMQAETVTLSFKPEAYMANNEEFIKAYPKLKMFTKYAKDANLWVIYEEVDGLINATLVEKETNKLVRILKLDYKVIYGDTLRILTNNNKEGDLRKELFIPIENKALASKIIKGETISKEERKEYYSKLPRVITDFRNPYSFIDRVDMSGLKISTEKWYQLVVNISTVLTNNLIPMCRFKVDEYKSPEDFLLVVTDQAPVFKSNIMKESSHKFALADKIAVDYDTKLYANNDEAKVFDHKYRIGHVD